MNILLISGHGAGDPGAVSNINGVQYREADQTRRVTAALKEILSHYCDVTVYPTAHNAYYDYQKGNLKQTASFSKYDYVLEIHFNAISASSSDGKTKGVECYVTTSEKGTTVESEICSQVSAQGLKNRGVKRYNWAVINTARRSGVSSALLEVCFIDDPDDMYVYLNNFDNIVKAIAKGLLDGFGIQNRVFKEEEDTMVIYNKMSDVPNWAKATVKKLQDKGYLKGEGSDNLNLEHNMLRGLVINDRAGLYDIKK